MKIVLLWLWRLAVGCLVIVLVLVAIFWKNDLSKDYLRGKYAAPPSAFMTMQGMEVHYRSEGNPNDSLPIVLLHGTGASLHTWDGWAAALAPERRVVRLDLPAYGLTGASPTGNYSINAYVAFLNEFLNRLHIRRCVLGGNSLGGSIAWNYALQHPEQIAALILVDAGGYPANQATPRQPPLAFQLATIPIVKNLFRYVLPRFVIEKSIANVYGNPAHISQQLVDRYYELSLHPSNRRAFIDRMKKGTQPTDTLLIKQLNVPTLVMWGGRDRLIPVECAYKFQRDLPNDTLVIFHELGHVPMEESPEQTVQAVQYFLNTLHKAAF
ncbi:MAG: alpha/beta hydrolase [Cytophagales bacterium]|nr:alpha/beta hydrolase [Bernardetiaceae bacterium]MDW8205697.1 alpha/beta hydrolase [Cytophagales bacterium]